jgi:hypothetical protein
MVSPESLPLRIAIVIAIGGAMAAALLLAACGNDHTPDSGPDAATDPDPLDVTDTPTPKSLDDIHERIIAKRCSGQPGLCHNGQFEPNMSTPAMAYAYLVARPGIEHASELRVKPGDPANSLFIDKIRNRNVSTQMPLGAEPLEEADIQDLEAWITAGALRAPGAQPVPTLNNPPKRPEIAIFNSGGTRLDGTGPVTIAAGTNLVIRHSVSDFETPDASIPFAGIVMIAADGRNVVLAPAAQDKSFAITTYDAAGPMGKGDLLDYRFNYTIPSSIPLLDKTTGMITNVPASGQVLTILAVYVDQPTMGIAAFDTSKTPIQIP